MKSVDGKYHCRHFYDPQECYEEVKTLAESYWSSRRNLSKSINYSFSETAEWTLGQMLLCGGFDLGVTLLYEKKQSIAFAGLRSFGPYTLCMGRFFCLGRISPLGTAFILPLHIKVSKEKGFTGTCFTMNHYNEHIKSYYLNRLPRLKGAIAQRAYESLQHFDYVGMREVNYVEQHVFEYRF